MSQWKKVLLLLAIMMIADLVLGQGCSQCKAIAEQGSGHGGTVVTEDSFGSNINYGILWLMAIPYVLLMIFFRKRIAGLYRALTKR
jgi:hypothetical protein